MPGLDWIFRIGVQVDSGDHLPSDRMAAHKIAMDLVPALTLENLRNGLDGPISPVVLDAISGKKPLKAGVGRVDGWLESVAGIETGKAPMHPVFHHDWGRRLAAQFALDPSHIDAEGLVALVSGTLEYLAKSATL